MTKHAYFKIMFLAIWMLFIFYMSNQVATTSSGLSSVFVEPIRPYASGFTEDIITTLVRKSAHIFMYFILGILTFNVLHGYSLSQKRVVVYSVLFALLYAITDEIHQMFVTGRSGEMRDVLIDTIGASFGIALYWTILRFINKRKLAKNVKK